VHVAKDQQNTQPLNDGCVTSVAELDFDATPAMGFAPR
jgi:hypothetical protein